MINYEALEFYDNGHLRICSICLRLAVSSLKGIQYLQIGPTGKRADTNENNMLKKFCLYGFVRWTKCIWCAIKNIYLLVYKLFEIAVEWIPAIKNKTVIIFVSKYHLHCCNYWSENNNYSVYLYLGYRGCHLSLLFKLYSFFSLALFSPGIHNVREKNLTKICF